ncbi:MAG: hypothetical protein AUJ71_02240 [Candidatus Omnitrophica bacterium CG1_02_49_16]|nr:MAG: hypothetical protein AUJ71_02240 [Candidatus Omnitrophica bacterium CG1_02_49_16]
MPNKEKEHKLVFSDFFKECRCRAGLGRKELAERLGIKTEEIVRWEKGLSFPSENHLVIITKNLHLQLWSYIQLKKLAGFRANDVEKRFYIKMRRLARFQGNAAETRS